MARHIQAPRCQTAEITKKEKLSPVFCVCVLLWPAYVKCVWSACVSVCICRLEPVVFRVGGCDLLRRAARRLRLPSAFSAACQNSCVLKLELSEYSRIMGPPPYKNTRSLKSDNPWRKLTVVTVFLLGAAVALKWLLFVTTMVLSVIYHHCYELTAFLLVPAIENE